MIEIGRVCRKIAGREANKVCCVVELIDDKFVTIDGDVKRRKCNINHIEPLDKVIKIKKGDSSQKIKETLEKEGFVLTKRGKKKEKKERPKKIKVKNLNESKEKPKK